MADLIASSKAKILSFANSLKQGASSVGKTAVNMLPPVQAYNAGRQMATPQFRQQVQQIPQQLNNFAKTSIQNTPVNRFDRVLPQIKSNIQGNLKALSDPNTSREWASGFSDNLGGNLLKGFTNNWIAPAVQIPYQAKQLMNKSNSKLDRGMAGLQLVGNVASTLLPGVEDVAWAGIQGIKNYNKSSLAGGNLKQNLEAFKLGATGQEFAGLGDAFIAGDSTAKEILNMAELPIAIMMGASVKNGQKVGFSDDIVNKFKNALQDPETRTTVQNFANMIENAKNPNRMNPSIKDEFGNIDDLGNRMQLIANDLFGRNTGTLSHTQLKNLFDILYQQAGDASKFNIKKIPLGLSTQNVREVDAQAGLSVSSTKGVESGFAPKVQQSSSGNIYIKTGKNEVVSGLPKTIQNDLYEITQGRPVNPDRMYKTSEFLRKKGFELVRNEDTFRYELKKVSPVTKGVESMPVSTKGNIGRQSDISQLDTVGQIASERAKSTIPSKEGKLRTKQQLASKNLSTSSNYITLKDVEEKIYGVASGIESTGTKKSVGWLGDQARKLEQGISNRVSIGLSSQNKMIQAMASVVQDLIGGAGKSGEQIRARATFKGGIDYGTKVASDTQTKIYDMLGRDNKSLERVHAFLDPEVSKLKIKESSLTPAEKEAVGILRVVSDFINDSNYQLGFISKEKWQSNQGGKYIARAYEPFDYPPEVADFIKDKSIKFDLQPFKTRGEVTDWKVENAIKDPAYLMGKRLQQTMFNQEVSKYMQFAKKSGLVSDVPLNGYTQLSDSKTYGDLAGKYIRKDALEDVRGFFMTNDVAQKAYDVLNWYDRNPIRKTQKALKTVFNPAVRLGNKTGNYVFAWLNGINPVTFAKNKIWANQAMKNNDPLYRQAIKDGLMGTDVTKADIARISAELKQGVPDKNIIQKIDEWAKESYGRVDDNSKLAALKTWLDRGIEPLEAINRVRRGFQDYNMVGMLYDLGAKLPILGNPFVRFASESVRIAKNAVVDHPIRAIATVAGWKMFTDVISRISGETEEDRKTREQRVGAAHIPFTDISFNVQTPWGEINASRLMGFSTTYTPEDATLSDLSKYSPIQNPLDKRNYGSDPLIGPMISLATDTDFRGKSIADPNSNKYTGSTLTGTERNLNRAGFLARAYLPPTATDLYNIGSAVQGKENVYGQKKTPTQAILRTYPGVKVEQFGAKEAQKRREQDAYFKGFKNEQIEKQINLVYKQELKGEITKDQVIKRVNDLQKNMVDTTSASTATAKSTTEPYKYLDKNGSMQTIEREWTQPKLELKGIPEIDKVILSKYKSEITSRQSDLIKLNNEKQITDQEMFKEYMDLEALKKAVVKLTPKKGKKLKIKKVSFPKSTFKVAKVKIKSLRSKKMKTLAVKKFISKI